MKFKVDIANRVQAKLHNYPNQFILILDNIDTYSQMVQDVIESLILAGNIRFLITTRDPALIPGIESIKINSFTLDESREYINNFVKINNFKKFTEIQMKKFIGCIMFENQVLPLKLRLTTSFLNENIKKNKGLDELLEVINNESNQNDIGEYLFKDLETNSMIYLIYCSYLNPDSIDLGLLNKLFDIENPGNFSSQENLKNRSLIEVDYKETNSVRIHRLVQDGAKKIQIKTRF